MRRTYSKPQIQVVETLVQYALLGMSAGGGTNIGNGGKASTSSVTEADANTSGDWDIW